MVLFPSLCQKHKEIFHDINCENLAQLLEVKFTRSVGALMTGSLGVFSLSDLFTLSLHQFISYGSAFPSVALVLRLVLLDYALVSCESLLGLFSCGEGYQFTL